MAEEPLSSFFNSEKVREDRLNVVGVATDISNGGMLTGLDFLGPSILVAKVEKKWIPLILASIRLRRFAPF
jgi:hypothetical protein